MRVFADIIRRACLGGAFVLALAACPAYGQLPPGCPAQEDISGSIIPGDEAVPIPGNATFTVHLDPSGGGINSGTDGQFGGVTWSNLSLGAGDYTFSAIPHGGVGAYFTAYGMGSLSCTTTTLPGPVLCPHCKGDIGTISIYGSKGALEGDVTGLLSGASKSNVTVDLGSNAFITNADSQGHFEFRATTEPFRSNNWALPVDCPGGPGQGYCNSVGITTYMAHVDNGDTMPATVTSSHLTEVSLTVYPSLFEPPPCTECNGKPGSPPSTNVGRPVDALTGNMHFSQVDAQIPGVAAGGLSFARVYNSLTGSAGRYGVFGHGWNTNYERRITLFASEPGAIVWRRGDGVPNYYYQDSPAGTSFHIRVPATGNTSIQKSGSTYTLSFLEGGSETYTSYPDSVARLTAITDASGNVTTLTRDANGALQSVSDPGGRSLSFTYTSGQLTQLSGPDGLIATYTYDAAGNLKTVAYPDGTGYSFTYDGFNQLLTVADAGNRILETHTYQGSTGMALTSEISGGVEHYTFAYNPGETLVTDALGNVTTYDYGSIRGQKVLVKLSGPCSACGGGGGAVQSWQYDSLGNATVHVDALGHKWLYTYDANGNVLTETDPLGNVTSSTYDSQNRLLSRTDALDHTTTYTWDPAGPHTITDPNNHTTTIDYVSGKPHTLTDPRGKITTLDYVPAGDLHTVTDPLSHATTFGYDLMGRRTTVTDALSHTTTTGYDARGRVTRVTSNDGTHTDFAYDNHGSRTSVTDPLLNQTRYTYDAYGRLDSVIDAMGGVTRYGYDTMGNLTSLTDANGHATRFEYDAFNRVQKTVYPGGAFESYTYDDAGRLVTKTDRKLVTTTYRYDDVGRLAGKTYSDGTAPVNYTYDAVGNLKTAANDVDTLTWAYDLAGQALTEQSAKNGTTVAYSFDEDGNRLTLSLNGTLFVSYGYDDASRLTTITRSANVFGLGYDNANRRINLTYPNGVGTTYTYDGMDRLTSLAASKGATAVTNFTYTYDAAGNRTSKQQLDYIENYTYDLLYRLTGVTRTGGGTGQWQYGYDAAGNRNTEQQDSTVVTSTYDQRNQLGARSAGGTMRWRGSLNEPGNVTFTSATVNGKPAQMLPGNVFQADIPTTPGTNTVTLQATDTSNNTTTKQYQVNVSGAGVTYTYDANGSLETKTENGVTRTYEWDAEGRLTRVADNGAEMARFKYDPFGRRVEKLAAGFITSWTYAAKDIVKQASGSQAITYVYGPNIDEPLLSDDGSTSRYFHADALGSIVATTSSAGAISSSGAYDAWGAPQNGAPLGGFGFTGRQWDGEIGLYYYRARYYSPTTGAFISEDPADFAFDLNLYRYVYGRPANLVDPSGLGGKRPRPPNVRPPSNAAFFICCKNGTFGVCDGPMANPSAFNNPLHNRQQLRCEKVHEQQHLDDIESGAFAELPADYCKGQPNNMPIAVPKDVKAKLECSAYKKQLECLSEAPGGMMDADVRSVKQKCKDYCGE